MQTIIQSSKGRTRLTSLEAEILCRLMRATAPIHHSAIHGNEKSLKVKLCLMRRLHGLEIPFGTWASGTYYLSDADRVKAAMLLGTP